MLIGHTVKVLAFPDGSVAETVFRNILLILPSKILDHYERAKNFNIFLTLS